MAVGGWPNGAATRDQRTSPPGPTTTAEAVGSTVSSLGDVWGPDVGDAKVPETTVGTSDAEGLVVQATAKSANETPAVSHGRLRVAGGLATAEVLHTASAAPGPAMNAPSRTRSAR